MIPRIGDWVKRHRDHAWVAACLLLVGWSAYNLGVLNARSGAVPAQETALFRDSAVSVPRPSPTGQGSRPTADHSDPRVVVSKSSSAKKYHYAWCASGLRIKESNRIWFPTEADALAAGYSLAGNCSR